VQTAIARAQPPRSRLALSPHAPLWRAAPPRRHLKLRNPTVAAEIYDRLLQNPSVPQREREVALRKLAECETMLGGESALST